MQTGCISRRALPCVQWKRGRAARNPVRDRVLVALQGRWRLQSSLPRISSKERPRQEGSRLGENPTQAKEAWAGHPARRSLGRSSSTRYLLQSQLPGFDPWLRKDSDGALDLIAAHKSDNEIILGPLLNPPPRVLHSLAEDSLE